MPKLRKSTAEIIRIFRYAVQKYDELCQGWLCAPGEEGKERKRIFMIMLNEMATDTNHEAILRAYDFYNREKSSSRLRECVGAALKNILGIRKTMKVGPASVRFAASVVEENNLYVRIEALRGCDIEMKEMPSLSIKIMRTY